MMTKIVQTILIGVVLVVIWDWQIALVALIAGFVVDRVFDNW